MYRKHNAIRPQVLALHAQRCSDEEIAEYLGTPARYVRQCLGRSAREGRYRAPEWVLARRRDRARVKGQGVT